MPKILIDGQNIEITPGTTILEAAALAGITIPSLCHHPDLTPYGGCRRGLVEVKVDHRPHSTRDDLSQFPFPRMSHQRLDHRGSRPYGAHCLSIHCCPDDLKALVVGFLWNQEFIRFVQEVASIQICETHDHIDAWLTHAQPKPEHWSRTSGCQGGVVQAAARLTLIRTPNEFFL